MNQVLCIVLVLVMNYVKTTTGVTNNKCIDNERLSLLDFKSLLQDPDDAFTTWTTEDCCQWWGVTCNNLTGHVTELNLAWSFLEGEISPSLFNLTYLTHLDLRRNHFSGIIPRSIGSLTKLRYLDLYNNSFSGTIPRSICFLNKLSHLDLGRNHFNGTIPPEFRNLTNLQELSLENLKRCTVENLDWLSHVPHLEHLDLNGISLNKADKWVNVILSLRNLSFLHLHGCELSQVVQPFSSSSSVKSSSSSIILLDLRNNNLNSSMYQWLFRLTSNKLFTLDLSGNMLDGIPKYLGNLCSLTSLYISDNSVAMKFSDFLNNLSGCTSVALQYLDTSQNQLIGSLSDEIQNFISLEILFADHNQLNETISEKVWELPKLHFLDISSNYLRGNVDKRVGKREISIINMSSNSFEVVPSKYQTSESSQAVHIDLSSCKLGPSFPTWFHTPKNFTYTSLNIANNGISDIIPVEFWNMRLLELEYLNLSSNNISGEVPDLSTNFAPFLSIDLSSNNFSGPIPKLPSTTATLDLSKNKFYGGIFFLCQIVDGSLTFVDLSNNLLSGHIPDCLWHFKELLVLNLRNNNLYGRIPASVQYLRELKVLHLYNNNFSGELPLSLGNCTELAFLDLGANKFFGNVPVWIGENLSRLTTLSLRSNKFFGPIPLQVCQLVNLQILDLSMNTLYGTIPSCLNNLTTMVQEGFLSTQSVYRYKIPWPDLTDDSSFLEFSNHAMIRWQGNIREFTTNLELLKSVDLSRNNLTGQIPYELTDLHGLVSLSLSMNSLFGEIPHKIGQMKKMLTLDLSGNHLSGEMPSTMSQMTSLNYLDVSFNHLSGRVPLGTQLQSFPASRYIGNIGLCGPPLSNNCPGDDELRLPPTIGTSEGDGEFGDELDRWFYIGGASGFSTGFWIVCSSLLLNRRGRHIFFHFIDRLRDYVYVKVMVSMAIFGRVA